MIISNCHLPWAKHDPSATMNQRPWPVRSSILFRSHDCPARIHLSMRLFPTACLHNDMMFRTTRCIIKARFAYWNNGWCSRKIWMSMHIHNWCINILYLRVKYTYWNNCVPKIFAYEHLRKKTNPPNLAVRKDSNTGMAPNKAGGEGPNGVVHTCCTLANAKKSALSGSSTW